MQIQTKNKIQIINLPVDSHCHAQKLSGIWERMEVHVALSGIIQS